MVTAMFGFTMISTMPLLMKQRNWQLDLLHYCGGMASAAKLALARLLSSRPVGRAIGTVTSHRIKHRGIAFDTTGWDPRVEAMLAFRLYESAEIRFVRSF